MSSQWQRQSQPTAEQEELQFLRQRIAELEHYIHTHVPGAPHGGSSDHVTHDGSTSHSPTPTNGEALLVLFNTISDGLLLLDRNQTVLTINKALAEMIGSTPAAMQGRSWAQICTNGHRVLCEPVQQTLQRQEGVRSRQHWRTAAGQNRILDIETMFLPANDPAQHRLMLRVIDVTERLQLEATLIQSEHRAAAEKLSATIAHEVNTPLQAIQSSLYMAERANDAQRTRHLSRAATQVERISSILERLLSLHHIDAVPPTLLDINTLFERLLDLLRTTLEMQQIVVQISLHPGLPRLWGKSDDLNQAFLNLLINAIEAMPNGGTLSIRTERGASQGLSGTGSDSSIRITISDTGHGMLPEIQAHAFDPFFTTRPNRQGIGLAVSRKTITEHGGHIQVHSLHGQGSNFVIHLPLPTPDHASSGPDALTD
jgi:PAS domain S-box-containing protein